MLIIMRNRNPYLSIVIPVYNSNINLLKVLTDIEKDSNLKKLKYEIILVNDGSTKKETLNILKKINKKKNCKIINLEKNLGQHYASLFGLKIARGEYLSTIDDDFEDDPKNIFRMLQCLKKNKFDVIYEKKIKQESPFRNFSSSINQYIIRKTFNLKKGFVTSSFKVFTKKINKKILLQNFYHPNLSCMILSATNNIGNYLDNKKRKKSDTRYTFVKLIKLNRTLILDHSNIFITLVFGLGLSSFMFGVFYSFYIILRNFTAGVLIPGWSTVVILISIFSSIILIFQFLSVILIQRLLNKKNISQLGY